ncbi:MAG: hypothetical protein LIP09_04990 [Bacteroidales bacterium]|nr:hypothetical protein [Bacteroidales bacterium]
MKAEWSTDGANYTKTTNLTHQAIYSDDGCKVKFSDSFAFDEPGTYFVALRVTSQRNGKDQFYTPITNIDRVRVVVV